MYMYQYPVTSTVCVKLTSTVCVKLCLSEALEGPRPRSRTIKV